MKHVHLASLTLVLAACSSPVPAGPDAGMDAATSTPDTSEPSGDARAFDAFAPSDAGCATPLTTQANCGTCGRACPSGQVCNAGECNPIGVSWLRSVTSASVTRLYSGALLSDGHLVVIGDMAGDLVDFSGRTILSHTGGADGYVLCIDPAASGPTVTWEQGVGGPSIEVTLALATSTSDALIVGGWHSTGATWDLGSVPRGAGRDVFVAAYDEAGGARWLNQWGGAMLDTPGAIAIAADGRAHVMSTVSDTLSIGMGVPFSARGESDVVIVAVEGSAGGIGHYYRFDSTGADGAGGVAVAPDGTIWATLAFTGTLDLGSGLTATSTGQDIALVHLREDAAAYTPISLEVFSGPGDESPGQLVVAPDGRLAWLVESTTAWDPGLGTVGDGGSDDAQVLVFSAGGELIDVHEFQSSGPDGAMTVVFDAVGNLYAAARVSGADRIVDGTTVTPVGGRDGVMASWDVTGAVRFVRSYGLAGSAAEMTFIAPDPARHALYVGGDSTTGVGVEGMTVTTADGFDGWIARLTF